MRFFKPARQNTSAKSLGTAARSLRIIQKGLLKLQRSALTKSRVWLVGICLLTALGAVFATQLKVLLSIDDLIDPDFKTYNDLRQLNAAFSDKNDLFLVVSAKDRALNGTELCAVQKWIVDEVDGREPYRKMFSAFGVQRALETDRSWRIESVLNPQCEKQTSTADISAQLHELQKTPWGVSLTSHDARDIAMSFYLNDGEKVSRYGRFDVDVVGRVIQSFKSKVTDRFPDLQAHFAGVALHQYYLKQGLDQTTIINAALPGLVLILFWIFFADIRPGILFSVTITIASITVYGLMAALKCPLDILTNILTLMLVLSSLEDFLFILHYNWSHEGGSWRKPFRRLLMPGFFTSFTTALGFASLYSADLAIIRRFGVYAAVASILEWALVFLFLPALLVHVPSLRKWLAPKPSARPRLRSWLEAATKFRFSRPICIGLLGMYLVSALGVSHLRVSDAPASIFPKDHVLSRDLDSIQKSRGWESQVSLVFNDFSMSDQNRKVLDKIRHETNVVAIESPYDVEDYLTKPLKEENASLVRQLWRTTSAARRLVTEDGTARALIYLQKTDTASIDQLQKTTAELCGQSCHLAGTLVSYTEFGDRILSTLLESLALSLVLVSGSIIYLLKARGHAHLTATLVSAMWGPCVMISVFWIFQFPVTYVTCTFASIIVGLAGDNTIQYLFATPPQAHLGQGLHRQGAASVQVSAMMILLSLIFLVSYFASVRSLTPLFVLGFFLTLVGDLWLFKFLTAD